jgi:hypothetical protein
MLVTVTEADDYFSTNYFSADAWEAIDDDTKELLLETAENDINTYLRTTDVHEDCVVTEKPYTPYQLAIFEWALYLYSHKTEVESAMQNNAFGATAIQVDGIGRNEYNNYSSQNQDAYNTIIKKSSAGRYLNMFYTDTRIIR